MTKSLYIFEFILVSMKLYSMNTRVIQCRLQPLLIQFLNQAKLADPDLTSPIMKTSWCRWNSHDQGYGCITPHKKNQCLASALDLWYGKAR